MKQSFSWWSFAGRGVGDEELMAGAKAIGYDAVELLPPALLDLTVRHGLAIASHNGHASIESGLNDAANHDRIAREIEESVALAVRYRIPNLIVFSGNRRPGLSDDEGAKIVADGVRRIVRIAENAGVTLVMELLNSRVDHKGYQCDRTDWLAGVIDEVGSPRFRALYDIYHMQVMEGDLIRTIDRHAPRIGHYHTAGNPGRHELTGERQEIAYPAVLRAIASTGYDGFIGHELIPTGDPLAALRDAFEICAAAALRIV